MSRFGRPDWDAQGSLSSIPDEMPIFVMTARDKAAPAALRAYAREAALIGASTDLVLSVQRHADAMELWAAEHGSKVPDLR